MGLGGEEAATFIHEEGARCIQAVQRRLGIARSYQLSCPVGNENRAALAVPPKNAKLKETPCLTRPHAYLPPESRR